MLITSNEIDAMMSVLWSKDYQVLPIKEYYNGQYNESAMVFSNYDNNELRKDLIFLLNQFHQDWAIIKYLGEENSTKVWKDGSERPLDVNLYNTDHQSPSYLYNGLSFSFSESIRYWKPKKKEDFKTGMIVEYLNNNKWNQKIVSEPNKEWDDMWKLLVKYDKLRSPCL